MTQATWSRQDVSRGHLNSAIRLLFAERSTLSVNLLSWAALDVLRDVAKSKGVSLPSQEFFKTSPTDFSKLQGWLKAAYNFSKHADRDPDRNLQFDDDWSLGPIYFATGDYQSVYSVITFEMVVFRGWFYCAHRDMWLGAETALDYLFELYGKDGSKRRASDILSLHDNDPVTIRNGLSMKELEPLPELVSF